MSTTFAIIPPHNDHDDQKPIEVAFRTSAKTPTGVSITWLNPLAIYLPPEQRVVAIDNTPQGVETMADLFKLFEDSL